MGRMKSSTGGAAEGWRKKSENKSHQSKIKKISRDNICDVFSKQVTNFMKKTKQMDGRRPGGVPVSRLKSFVLL